MCRSSCFLFLALLAVFPINLFAEKSATPDVHATSKPAGGGHPSAEATNSDGLLVFSCHPDDDVWEKRTHSDEASLREVFGKVQIVHLHRSRALGEDETVRQIRKVIEEHPGSRVAFNCDGGAGKELFRARRRGRRNQN